jgi:hypothetical protein
MHPQCYYTGYYSNRWQQPPHRPKQHQISPTQLLVTAAPASIRLDPLSSITLLITTASVHPHHHISTSTSTAASSPTRHRQTSPSKHAPCQHHPTPAPLASPEPDGSTQHKYHSLTPPHHHSSPNQLSPTLHHIPSA